MSSGASSHSTTRFAALKRLPVIGYLLRWLAQLVRLPGITPRLDNLDASVRAAEQVSNVLAARVAGLEGQLRAEMERARSSDEALRVALDMLESRKADADALRALSDRLQGLDLRMGEVDRRAGELTSRVDAVGARIDDVREDLMPTTISPPGDPAAFSTHYRAFEDRFRGSREEIRARLGVYAPMLQAAAATDPAHARFIDLGCGRGELLELLRDLGLSAYGVDASAAMLAACRERDLAVQEGDALVHLAGLPDAALAGITCIHVLEHLPFRAVMGLFAHVHRVLRPGGVAIFETPNPENLIVGACNFYYDPTHMRPLPPEPMRYLLQSAGFRDVSIERLHPGATLADVDAAADPVTRVYATIMNVPQDYALIAYKAPSQTAEAAP